MVMHNSDSSVADASLAEQIYETARSFVPRIDKLAPGMCAERRLDGQLVEDMDKAGLFSVLVQKRWGGVGLGPRRMHHLDERQRYVVHGFGGPGKGHP